jgi:hypothetical protein
MSRKPFEVVAMLPEPGAATPFRGERKVLPSKDFRKLWHRYFDKHFAVLYNTD